MPNFPFFRYPYFNNYYRYNFTRNYKTNQINNNFNKYQETYNKLNKDNNALNNNITLEYSGSETHGESDSEQVFEIFGIKLYFDDVLLIALLILLYNEGVKDYSLFISLILLLIS